MKQIILRFLFIFALCLLLGSTFILAKSSPLEEKLTATPESYFDNDDIEPPYNPCKYPYLQYEHSQESEQRKKQCGVKQ